MITEKDLRKFTIFMIIFAILAISYLNMVNKQQKEHMPKPSSIPERTSYEYAPSSQNPVSIF